MQARLDGLAAARQERRGRRHNLPASPDELIGRHELLGVIRSELARGRLVTLTGTGGSGKTRLAVAAAATEAETGQHADGAWLAELAALGESALVPQAVAAAVSIADSGVSPTESVIEYFRGLDALLVIDNCEHLVEAVAGFVVRLLRSCPGLRVLATSREPLCVQGEVVVEISGLDLAPRVAAADGGVGRGLAPAVELFVRRASARDRGFRSSPGNLMAADAICRRLDGLPLAIELAAAWADIFSVSEIERRLEDRFSLLVRAPRGAPGRHATLRAALDWSYELLDAGERSVLARLSVFAGQFDLRAAGAVVGLDESAVLACVSSLRAKSLLVADPRGKVTWFGMLESTRAYARQMLTENGDFDTARQAFGDHFVARAFAAFEQFRTGSQAVAATDVVANLENYRAAMRWLEDQQAWEGFLVIAVSIWHYFNLVGADAEASFWLERGVEPDHRRGVSPPLAILALTFLGETLRRRGDLDGARRVHAAALGLCPACDDRLVVAWAESMIGAFEVFLGNYGAARPWYESSLRTFRELDQPAETALLLNSLGHLADREGDETAAQSLFEECVALGRSLGHELRICIGLNGLATLAERRREPLRSRVLREEILSIAEPLGVKIFVGLAQLGLAYDDILLGDTARAGERAEAALAELADARFRDGESAAHSLLGTRARLLGDLHRSAHEHAAALAIRIRTRDASGIAQSLVAIARLATEAGSPVHARRWAGAGVRIGTRGTFASFEDDPAVLDRAPAGLAHESDDESDSGGTDNMDTAAQEALAWCRALAAARDTIPGSDCERPFVPLTRREAQVMARVAAGQTNKQVAASLGMSSHTVATHIANAYRKLGARNRADAVRITVANG